MTEPVRPPSCCACICFRRTPNKAKPEEDEDTSSIVFYRKFSDVWEEDSGEEEIITCSQPLDDHVERRLGNRHHPLHHQSHHPHQQQQHPQLGDPCHRRDYRKYIESMRCSGGSGSGNGASVASGHRAGSPGLGGLRGDSTSDVTSWVETPDSGEQTVLIGSGSGGGSRARQSSQRMRASRRLLTLPLKEDQYGTDFDEALSLESECGDELSRQCAADLSFSIDDSLSNFMQSRVTMWTAGSGLLAEEDTQMFQDEVWSIHSDSAILLRDYMYPNEDWQASLDSFGSDLDLSPDADGDEDDGDEEEEEEEDEEDENGNADESTKILSKRTKKKSSSSGANTTTTSTTIGGSGGGAINTTSGSSRRNTEKTDSRGEENGNGNRKYYRKSPMSLPGDAYRPVRNSFDIDTAHVHRNINDTRKCLRGQETRWNQGTKRKEVMTPDDVIQEQPLRRSEIAA